MKEPKKEYWQDRASNIIIVVGVIITLLIPIVLNSNIRNNFSSYQSNNSGSNNYEQRTNVIDSGVQKYQPIPDVVGLDYNNSDRRSSIPRGKLLSFCFQMGIIKGES